MSAPNIITYLNFLVILGIISSAYALYLMGGAAVNWFIQARVAHALNKDRDYSYVGKHRCARKGFGLLEPVTECTTLVMHPVHPSVFEEEEPALSLKDQLHDAKN